MSSWFESLTAPDFSGLPLATILAMDAAATAHFAPKTKKDELAEVPVANESAVTMRNELREPHTFRAIGKMFMPSASDKSSADVVIA